MSVRIVTALLVVSAAFVSALTAANEATPDCEDGQVNRAEGSGIMACEGEHWDGQDPIASDGLCGPTDVDFDSNAACVAVNGGSDPQPPGLVPPIFARASVQYGGTGAVYTSQGAYGVGEQAAYADVGGTVSWYGRDNTDQLAPFGTPVFEPVIAAINGDPEEGGADGNLIAWIVGAQGDYTPSEIGPVAAYKTGEGDCTQATYQASDCERDNTAVTVELVP